ncbi:MAG: hypothetical protein NC434_05725 [Ruminococcus sp.]|nr:hypothetical protein [Ruminococcus sp.]
MMLKIAKQILLIALPVLEILWVIVLLFMEKDYIGSIQIGIAILSVTITIILGIAVNKTKKLRWKRIIYIVMVAGLFIIDIVWSLGIMRQRKEITVLSTGALAENSDSEEVEVLEKNLKSLVLENDQFLKSLPEYTHVQGSDPDKITAVFVNEITEWMKKWDILSLGEFGDGYINGRNRIDEIYNIYCLAAMDSKFIKDLAVDSFKLCIGEIKKLNNEYPNPELLKEEADKYIELGDLCARLGKQSEAADYYIEAIDIAWEGLEESIKYGMSKNAKEVLEIMSVAYKRVETLPQEFDEWDCKRASDIGDVLHDLAVSFDDRFPHS